MQPAHRRPPRRHIRPRAGRRRRSRRCRNSCSGCARRAAVDKRGRDVDARVSDRRPAGPPGLGEAAGAAAHVEHRFGLRRRARAGSGARSDTGRRAGCDASRSTRRGRDGRPSQARSSERESARDVVIVDDLPETVHVCERRRRSWRIAPPGTSLTPPAAAVSERGRFTLCLSGGDTPAEPTRCSARSWRTRYRGRPFTCSGATSAASRSSGPTTTSRWRPSSCSPACRSRPRTSTAPVARPPIRPPRRSSTRRAPRASSADPDGLPSSISSCSGWARTATWPRSSPAALAGRERERWVVDHYVVKRGERVRRLTLTMPVLSCRSGGHGAG